MSDRDHQSVGTAMRKHSEDLPGLQLPKPPSRVEGPHNQQGCICGMSSVNSASIDPPHQVINKNCPLHGNEAARDPDGAYERHRDEPPMRMWGED